MRGVDVESTGVIEGMVVLECVEERYKITA
jgi:hypothetical protein